MKFHDFTHVKCYRENYKMALIKTERKKNYHLYIILKETTV